MVSALLLRGLGEVGQTGDPVTPSWRGGSTAWLCLGVHVCAPACAAQQDGVPVCALSLRRLAGGSLGCLAEGERAGGSAGLQGGQREPLRGSGLPCAPRSSAGAAGIRV